MTINWTPSGDEWAGETVAVVGNGPTAKADVAKLPAGCKIVAAHRGIAHAPHADMLVTIDDYDRPPEDYKGLFVNGTPGPDLPGLFPGLIYERLEIEPGNIVELRNNALLAIRMAVRMGARAILLAGFDTGAYEQLHNFPWFGQALDALMGELRGRGIAVDFIE